MVLTFQRCNHVYIRLAIADIVDIDIVSAAFFDPKILVITISDLILFHHFSQSSERFSISAMK